MVKKMVVAIYGAFPGGWVRHGTLYGGSTSGHATNPSYWLPLRMDHEPHALFFAERVPDKLAAAVEAQGTPDQTFDDGYTALEAISPYLDKEPFYESPESWATEKTEEDED